MKLKKPKKIKNIKLKKKMTVKKIKMNFIKILVVGACIFFYFLIIISKCWKNKFC